MGNQSLDSFGRVLRAPGLVENGPESARLLDIVHSLSQLFGGGEVITFAMVTEHASVVGNRTDDGALSVTVGRVVDATAAVRRLVRVRPGPRP